MNVADQKFLVVDDLSGMRGIVQALLRDLGCQQVDRAKHGVAALKAGAAA